MMFGKYLYNMGGSYNAIHNISLLFHSCPLFCNEVRKSDAALCIDHPDKSPGKSLSRSLLSQPRYPLVTAIIIMTTNCTLTILISRTSYLLSASDSVEFPI